jgi:hypothetical protein
MATDDDTVFTEEDMEGLGELIGAVERAMLHHCIPHMDEYAHLLIEGLVSPRVVRPGEMLVGMIAEGQARDLSMAECLAKAVPAAFLQQACIMLMEGLHQDANHVCHELLLGILEMPIEKRKEFWDAHKAVTEEESGE